MSATGNTPRSLAIPPLSVRTEDGRTFRFTRPFNIGREHDCEVRIEDGLVSRKHVIVSFGNGRWRIRDQRSGNGVFVDGHRVESASIDSTLTIQLGTDGPLVTMELAPQGLPTPPPAPPIAAGETRIVASYAEKYFGTTTDEEAVGGRTLMIRKAFQQVQKKQRRAYGGIVAVVALLAVAAAGYAYYGHRQMAQQQAVAQDLFYTMKSLDMDIADVERRLATSGGAKDQDLVKTYQARRKQMEINYDRFIAGLKLYDHALTPQEQTILRVTRLFGECETAAPPEYLAEVGNYIRQWQQTSTYATAVKRAQDNGYVKTIAAEFEKQDLPAQFFYLALVESGFNEVASGPPTRMGFAKGMWQFVPDTAKRFGLTVGPLAAFPRPDPGDDRHRWEKATHAAAAYIKEIYSTDAQASGLLVMASYNWGEQRVIRMLRTMPANPRERNFWKVLEQHRDQVPAETYNYVMRIVSAAVIGENPKLFGFAFDSPLGATANP
jgi:membrane-bound lytic murein transglycosylase D